ncbi:hypothetical protein TIFTF001_020064 [Ficus carica]|uniref:Uncharacterized protein n=1 Tax=Ficus carica TaxID=3494 RepID=A0AA88ATM3_FICCA|nr:hypothetical protein TIFTF001_020064 [Ficus carica]
MAHQFDNRYVTLPKFVIDCVGRRFAAGEDAEWSGGLEAASTRWRTLGYGGE